jgi:hypothetical protein
MFVNLLTSRPISASADCTQQYVTQLARAGLIPYVTASDGTRLFSAEVVSSIRKIKAERLSRRGLKKAT